MHGVARVMVKDYGQKRTRELRRLLSANERTKPKVDHAKELKRLIHDSETKYGVTVTYGAQQDGPVH